MKVYTLQKEQFIERPLPDVFPFFTRPENLATITPPSMGFRMLTPSPVSMKNGAVIDYSIKVMGVRIPWRSVISEYEPMRKFVDEQLKGPYSLWHHTHLFAEARNGTLIRDEVHYALPFGLFGQLVHSLIVKKQLERIFRHRARVIHQLFTSEQSTRHVHGLTRELTS